MEVRAVVPTCLAATFVAVRTLAVEGGLVLAARAAVWPTPVLPE